MPYSNIDKPSKYFNTLTYTGNNSTGNSITGVGFKPDFVWIKRRSGDTNDHVLFDLVRGATKRLISNATSAETTNTDTLSAFNTDGFTVNINDTVNASSPYVAWNWLANNTSGSSNTAGSITSTVSANTTSGFSIVSYTGTASVATVGHGLGVTPACFITKCRSNSATAWGMYHQGVGNTAFMELDSTAAKQTNIAYFNNTSPTSSVFTIGTDSINNGSGLTFIAYCFAEVKGYSKFGSYTGNGSADGTFIYTGFKPAFFLNKRTDTTSGVWFMFDNKRATYNVVDKELYANTSDAEASAGRIDFLSNGFKIRDTSTSLNASGGTYIYMAFAENPFCSSKGIPTTAR